MLVKEILKVLLLGAATALGGILVTKTVEVASDPYTREKIKSKFTKKEETQTES